jgi:8-oxo-dGTP diphosphatase
MNPFEAGVRKAIPAVLVYARSASELLMLHRDAPGRPPGQEPDYHAGKWNGLGGKLELDESPLQAARRELQEESGLDLPEERFRCLGWLTFPNFKPHKHEDWLVYVFEARVTEEERGSPVQGPEGSLHWIAAEKVKDLNLWAGDRHFIQYVAAGRTFWGTLWYQGQAVVRAQVSALG